jgi:GntR family transcriptional regulator
LNLADGQPFALVTVWCPEVYGAELSRADVERSPFYELIGVPLGGAVQTIGAAAASATEADLLGVPEGSPVLRCERVTRSVDGEPVLMSEHVFPSHLTEFVVDLPQAEPSIAPSGLRLVE